jgi:peptide deformylase
VPLAIALQRTILGTFANAKPEGGLTVRLRFYPDPILRRRTEPLKPPRSSEGVENELLARVREMFRIMEEEGGIGLAGPQAGWPGRIFVTRIPVGEAEGDRRVYVNPVVIEADGEEEAEEGCLSFPEVRGRIVRHTRVVLRAQDLDGSSFEEEGVGLTARCWEHELDHLDGILFTSRMSAGDRLQIKQALRELEEKYQKANRLSGKSSR